MALPPSLSTAVAPRAIRTRVQVKIEYDKQDFLHGNPHDINTPDLHPVGVSNGNRKFARGFNRRQLASMQPAAERERAELVAAERQKAAAIRRTERLQTEANRNGDVVAHYKMYTDLTPTAAAAAQNNTDTAASSRPGRKHFSNHLMRSEDGASATREQLGSNRYFHAAPGDATARRTAIHQQQREQTTRDGVDNNKRSAHRQHLQSSIFN